MTSPVVRNPHPNAHSSAGAYTNAAQVGLVMRATGDRAARRVGQLTRQYGQLLETRIKGKASGRPGPRRRTGDYVRSWNTVVTHTGDQVRATVGTNAPQARRLEYGFVGEDRAGRVYDQPPFPHVGPALAETTPQYLGAVRQAIRVWSE